MTPRQFDERDIRTRPKRSMPRSKDRPDYSALPIAFVTTVDRGRITAILDSRLSSGSSSGQEITAMKARELGKNAVVVGDQIRLAGDISGAEGSLARAVEVLPRRNQLARTVDDVGAHEKVVVANVDQLVIVTAAADPEPRHGFVARCLAVAYDQGITPILVMTKCDLADPTEFLAPYRALDVRVLRTHRVGKIEGVTELATQLASKKSVLIGHSGVGKSTLFNALVGNSNRSTGDVNLATGRGRHTSSSAIAVLLDNGGWVIDTPGIRSFGLEHLDLARVISSFEDLAAVIARCPKLCSHNETGCALNEISIDSPSFARVASLRRLLADTSQPIT